mgnify:FL=1
MNKELEKEFDEIQFARVPTEEQEPFFWRWRKEAKDILLSFISGQMKRSYNLALDNALEALPKERLDKDTIPKIANNPRFIETVQHQNIGFNAAIKESREAIEKLKEAIV